MRRQDYGLPADLLASTAVNAVELLWRFASAATKRRLLRSLSSRRANRLTKLDGVLRVSVVSIGVFRHIHGIAFPLNVFQILLKALY
jgi:hypothetical protein